MPTKEQDQKVRQAASMQYWWPKLKDSGVNTPKTTVIKIRDWDTATDDVGEGVAVPDPEPIAEAVAEYGPPAFIRTDQASNKHQMDKSSRVPSADVETVRSHVFDLLRFNKMADVFGGLPWRDIVVREWLNLQHTFQAFNRTPIAAEMRVFIYQNEVHDWGFYWPAAAIENHHSHQPELPEDWREQLQTLKDETTDCFADEIQPLAQTVADEFDGYWSIDFARTESGEWYAIDMAPGVASWHPDACEKPDLDGLSLGV